MFALLFGEQHVEHAVEWSPWCLCLCWRWSQRKAGVRHYNELTDVLHSKDKAFGHELIVLPWESHLSCQHVLARAYAISGVLAQKDRTVDEQELRGMLAMLRNLSGSCYETVGDAVAVHQVQTVRATHMHEGHEATLPCIHACHTSCHLAKMLLGWLLKLYAPMPNLLQAIDGLASTWALLDTELDPPQVQDIRISMDRLRYIHSFDRSLDAAFSRSEQEERVAYETLHDRPGGVLRAR